jgi:hypothetical protein
MNSSFIMLTAYTYDITEKAEELYHRFSSVEGKKAFFHRNVTCRLLHFSCVLLYPPTAAIDLALGTILALGAILTVGRFRPLNILARSLTHFAGLCLVGYTFRSILGAINPAVDKKAFAATDKDLNGLVHNLVAMPIKKQARTYSLSNNVAARFLSLSYALVSPFTRIIDFVMGIFLMIAAIGTYGKIDEINGVAFEVLRGPIFISDVFHGIIRTINPGCELKTKTN